MHLDMQYLAVQGRLSVIKHCTVLTWFSSTMFIITSASCRLQTRLIDRLNWLFAKVKIMTYIMMSPAKGEVAERGESFSALNSDNHTRFRNNG